MTNTAQTKQKAFARFGKGKLLLLALVLIGLWYLADPTVPDEEERALWNRVRAAQLHLSHWRQQEGAATAVEHDPWDCGLVGLEWSSITTTLGDLEAKRTACNPAWAIQFKRWFQDLGLEAGDHIAIYSSASFPGLLLNAVTAAESMQLDPLLIVSLGASTWGANHPDAPWPVLESELLRAGFIHKQADFYTLGAGDEMGHGLSQEDQTVLRQAADEAGVGILIAADLDAMVTLKTELLIAHQPRLFINIGGSQANLGDAEDVLRLSRGLVPASEADLAGNGVIARAMHNDIPVIHMLNIRSIANTVGIPYDSTPSGAAPIRMNPRWSVTGLLLFFAVLFGHRRWKLETDDD